MKNPWKIDSPFEPMFDEFIKVTATRNAKTLTQTVQCCVFNDATGDVLYDGNVQTERQDITIYFRKDDWKFVESLQTGDKISRLSTNLEYVISDVKQDAFYGWFVTARGA